MTRIPDRTSPTEDHDAERTVSHVKTGTPIGAKAPPETDQLDADGDVRDRAADERDHSGDERDYAADERDIAADHRDQERSDRDQAADQRDHDAAVRDDVAQLRDLDADQRDVAAGRRDIKASTDDHLGTDPVDAVASVGLDPQTPVLVEAIDRSQRARGEAAADRYRALRDRQAAAQERAGAEHDRASALTDRGSGSAARGQADSDRQLSKADRRSGDQDRRQSKTDRRVAAAERRRASLDGLTGVYGRGPGFLELKREMARAKRTGQPLSVAFFDVDNLKVINDTRGHAAGDQVLVRIAGSLRAHLRTYDLIIRYGGDEFVCVLIGLTKKVAEHRFQDVVEALNDDRNLGSVTAGVADMQPSDTAEELIARADTQLYQKRLEHRHLPIPPAQT